MKTVEMTLEGGGTMLVEVEDPEQTATAGFRSQTGVREALGGADFGATIARIREPIETIMGTLKDLPIVPEKLAVEFSIKFTSEGGLIFASAKAEGGLVIKLEWSPRSGAAAG